ncbi:hypothetical protein KOR42_32660 [Thalassoglobus neptunius]|uniref:Uncharacterized protein n=1 Tax=Thalassoglobus neptunius TaxID=1938619 RepID=A0A5C5WPP2_9PLAN|nr:hypothetical protein KOR42_32660 [Thalassoglobus neptunius]
MAIVTVGTGYEGSDSKLLTDSSALPQHNSTCEKSDKQDGLLEQNLHAYG